MILIALSLAGASFASNLVTAESSSLKLIVYGATGRVGSRTDAGCVPAYLNNAMLCECFLMLKKDIKISAHSAMIYQQTRLCGLVKDWFRFTLLLFLLLPDSPVYADELIVNFGGGNQLDTSQHNKTFGLDYSFYRKVRSYRQHFLLGVSVTHMTTDATANQTVNSISLYPQINLYPRSQDWGQPFFFVRALGPSYISSNRLGEREQKHHFSFQAQVGYGAYLHFQDKRNAIISVSFKHFSNANIFSGNDGFDFPFVLSLGTSF